ncbi:ABC transporter permease [Maribellus maritimus]|uniref:ABC transporter permease n=1 Tax=Maribellus maritimus TaxID=2870838 RepID=UPI001EEB3434|nr:ABC transporter permease [Maribellus maritimus]MCG6188314.1 ABC transporter permease [Maribellus maritimus]
MKTKKSLFAVTKRELRRIFHNPAYRFLLLLGPIIGIGLLFFIFHKGVVKELPVAVVDRDNSTLSIKIANALDASSDADVTVQTPDIFKAREMLKQGLVEAIVVIPFETEKSVFQGIRAEIPVYINGTNVLKAGILQRSVLTTIKTISGSVQLQKLMMTGKNEEEAMARIIPVNIQRHVLFNPFTNYSYFLNSALMYVMLFLFVLLSSIYTLGNELKRGTGLDLLETSRNSVRLAIVGKLLPYTVIFSVFALSINILLYKIEGMPLNGNYLIIFGAQFVTILTYQLMALIFVGTTINLRLALSIASAYSMMGITFSGLTFPLEAMPKFAQIFASLFPFTWWQKLFISQSLRGAPLKEALPYICYILVFLLVSLCFMPFYKHYLENPKYWGKS